MRVPIFTATKINALPLKEMDPLMLSHSLSVHVQKVPEINSDAVDAAVEFASYVHRNDKRENRAGFPKTAYIEHPLRNAIRVLRFGTRNQSVVLGCLLHDTVEDHAKEIAEEFLGVFYPEEHVSREVSFKFIGSNFGEGVERVVRGMSNPLLNVSTLTVEEKHAIYFNHVAEATKDDEVLICKISDYVDNALSLHHTSLAMKPQRLQRLASKYLPLYDLFMTRLEEAENLPVTAEGRAEIITRLHEGQKRLVVFAEAV